MSKGHGWCLKKKKNLLAWPPSARNITTTFPELMF